MTSKLKPPLPSIPGTLSALSEDGFCVLKNVFTKEQIASFEKKHFEDFDYLKENVIQEKNRKEHDYLTGMGEKIYGRQKYYDFEGHKVLELAKGRYDTTWGMDKKPFNQRSFFEAEQVLSLVKEYLIADYKHYAGSLPTFSQSDNGPWHRDVYNLFDDEKLLIGLAPCYLTALIPLVDITEENGPTEMLVGSHKKCAEEAHASCEKRLVLAKAGDVILFDGRCIHRGSANSSKKARPILYIVYTKRWYCDYSGSDFVEMRGSKTT